MNDSADDKPFSDPDEDAADEAIPADPFGEAEGTSAEAESPETEEEEELDPVARLEADVARWRDLALRSQADLDNYRKRMAREKSDAVRYANTGLLESLLPILDNFALGLGAAREEKSSNIYQGLSMVLKQIDDFLKEQGVETIPAENTPFDPNLHEAVREEHSDVVPDGHVISEIRKGYKLKDRLLRASNIIVSKGSKESDADSESVSQEKSNT